MKYNHRFQVRVPLSAVVEFHSHSASMAAITPPPIIVRIDEAPDVLQDGDEMAFTLWLGPLPLRWRARIEQVGPTGFVDRLLTGPYKSWVHRHAYSVVGPTATEVLDMVSVELSEQPFWRLIGLGMWLGMPLLFSYRGWRTRRLLETHAARTQRFERTNPGQEIAK